MIDKKKNFNYERYYKNYWLEEFEKRDKDRYYEKLYDEFKADMMVSKRLKILDVGGGNGHFLKYMGYKSATVLDISDLGLAFAKKFGYHTIKADVLKRYPIPEESYDVAYCFEVLEHLDKPNKTLCEIHDILKKNGTLFISVPNFKPDGIHHKKRWKYNELRADLKKCGYNILWFKKIPRFNTSYRNILKTKNSILTKITLIMGHTIFFKELRCLLSNIFPNMFVAFYVVKCEKE
jgi:SAM-dependent methyltransferase